MLTFRTLTVLAAVGLLAIGLGFSGNPSVTERINYAHADLKSVQADIPQAQLHARALEILSSITIAADDEPKGN